MPCSPPASSECSSGEWLTPPFRLRTNSIAVGTPAAASTIASCPAPETTRGAVGSSSLSTPRARRRRRRQQLAQPLERAPAHRHRLELPRRLEADRGHERVERLGGRSP